MTRGAIPLPGTPSKKRSWTIPASDVTSNNDPISPQRYADSDFRPLKRLCNSETADRRTSAPFEVSIEIPDMDDLQRMAIKQQSTVCTWIQKSVMILTVSRATVGTKWYSVASANI
jgi:hypothetical protein